MADRLEEILGKRFNSLKELKEEIKRLQDSIVNLNTDSEEFIDTNKKLIAAQEQYTSVSRATRDVINANTGSLAEMERQYRNMYQEYKNMSKAARDSSKGLDLKDKLESLSNSINNIKKGVGDFKSNIGRYSESIIDAFTKMGGSVSGLVGPFKTATQGITAFNTALKANPVGAVITLIMTLIAVLKQLGASIKDDEENQMRMNEAMASFQPIIDAAKNAMTAFGGAIVKVVEFLGKAIDKAREAIAAFTDFLGITKGAKDAVKDQQKIYKDLAKSTNELTKTKREYQKLNAADKAEVERLREEASETDNLTEKRALLQQAKDKQAEIDQRNIEVAKEELRILEEQSKLTTNSAEDNEKLAAAVAKVSEAEASAAANARMFNKQLNGTEKATTSAAGAVKNYREEAKKLYEQLVEDSKDELTKLADKYEEEKKILEKGNMPITLLTQRYERERSAIVANELRKRREILNNYAQSETESWERFEEATTTKTEQLESKITTYARVVPEKLKAINDAYNDVANGVYDNNQKLFTAIEEGVGAFTGSADDYEGIMDLMNAKAEQYSQTIPTYSAKFKEAAEAMKELGEEGWVKLVEPITKATDEANRFDGVAVKSLLDVESASNEAAKKVEDLKNELAEVLGEEAFDRISKMASSQNYNLMEAFFHLDPSMYGSWDEMTNFIREGEYVILEEQKAAYETELANFQGTQDQKLEMYQQYYDVVNEMRAREAELAQLSEERNRGVMDASIGLLGDIYNSVNSVSNAYSSLIDSEVKLGKITEAEAKKKKNALIAMEKVALAVNIAQIAASTAAGIMDVWKGWGGEIALNAQTAAATGPAAAATKAALDAKSTAAAIMRTAALGTTGAANIAAATMGSIAKINNMKAELEGGAGTTGTAAIANVQEIDSTPYTYTRTLQTQEEYDDLTNRPVWVSVVDIMNMERHVKVVEDESSF